MLFRFFFIYFLFIYLFIYLFILVLSNFSDSYPEMLHGSLKSLQKSQKRAPLTFIKIIFWKLM